MNLEEIKQYLNEYSGPELKIMEVCGSHTAAIAGNGIAILRVKSVQGGTPTEDLYATIDDEGPIGTILEEAFSSSEKIYDATTGHIAFKRLRDIEKIAGVPQSPLRSIAPVQAEQSNSAFTSERFFFKLYRRL